MLSPWKLQLWHISCLTAGPQGSFPVRGRGPRRPAGGPGNGGRPPGPVVPRDRLPLWRRLRRRAWWLVVLAVAALAGRLAPGPGRAAGAGLARLALRVRPRERRLAAANLARVFPGLDARERERLLGSSAEAAGRNLYDALAAGRLLAAPGLVRDEPGPDGRPLVALVAAEAAAGNGVLVLSGHLGCWELFGAWLAGELARAGLPPLHVATGVVRNPAVDRWLDARRRSAGLVPVPRTVGVVPLVRCLRRGGVIAALVDQNTGVDSRRVPFLGAPAPTPAGPARLAVRLGTPVVVATIARAPDGGHVVTHGPVWRPRPGGEAGAQVDECLAWVNREIGERVRRNPAEWVWYHRRWDEPPGGGRHGSRN